MTLKRNAKQISLSFTLEKGENNHSLKKPYNFQLLVLISKPISQARTKGHSIPWEMGFSKVTITKSTGQNILWGLNGKSRPSSTCFIQERNKFSPQVLRSRFALDQREGWGRAQQLLALTRRGGVSEWLCSSLGTTKTLYWQILLCGSKNWTYGLLKDTGWSKGLGVAPPSARSTPRCALRGLCL